MAICDCCFFGYDHNMLPIQSHDSYFSVCLMLFVPFVSGWTILCVCVCGVCVCVCVCVWRGEGAGVCVSVGGGGGGCAANSYHVNNMQNANYTFLF